MFSLVKVKVAHLPPTGVLSSSPFMPHTVSLSPTLAGSALGPGQEQVLDLEATVDKLQPETSVSSRNPLLLGPLLRLLLHHWKIFTRTSPRTRNLHLGHRTGNRHLMMTYRNIKLTVLRLTHRKRTGFIQRITETGRGHGGRVVTLSPPTSVAGVRSPSWP